MFVFIYFFSLTLIPQPLLIYFVSLELCPECREGLLCQQQRDLREYTQATIYVHKVVDNKKVPVPLVAMTSNDQACFLTCGWIFTEACLGSHFSFLGAIWHKNRNRIRSENE